MSKFTIPGEPTGKARPRVTRWGTHNTEKTVCYENLVKTAYDGVLHEGNIEMTVKAYYSIPKQTSKKKREQMAKGEILPTKKPDCDNVLKIIADALNKIAYNDDAQIVRAVVEKYFSDVPRVEVEINEL
ncbi:MAG: RusA family crossover junction endodeoxyribonuclease [Aminipila sp.]